MTRQKSGKPMEDSIRIDPNNLDKEWLSQPVLYHKYASQQADARRDLDEAKADLDVTKAELDKKIRSDPSAYGLAKTTEGAIASTIIETEEHREANQAVIDARHELDMMTAVVSALDHRKTALSKLVDLFLSDYYSKPRASEDAKEKMDGVEKKSIRRGRERKPREDDGWEDE